MNRRDILLGVATVAPVAAVGTSLAAETAVLPIEPQAAMRPHPMAQMLHGLIDEFFEARDRMENKEYGLERAHAIAQQIELTLAEQLHQLGVGVPVEHARLAWLGNLTLQASRMVMRECVAASRQPDGHYRYSQLIAVKSRVSILEHMTDRLTEHAERELKLLSPEEIAQGPVA